MTEVAVNGSEISLNGAFRSHTYYIQLKRKKSAENRQKSVENWYFGRLEIYSVERSEIR